MTKETKQVLKDYFKYKTQNKLNGVIKFPDQVFVEFFSKTAQERKAELKSFIDDVRLAKFDATIESIDDKLKDDPDMEVDDVIRLGDQVERIKKFKKDYKKAKADLGIT